MSKAVFTVQADKAYQSAVETMHELREKGWGVDLITYGPGSDPASYELVARRVFRAAD